MSAPGPYWSDGEDVRLFLGDCREVLRGFEPESFDAVICDPPYSLEFMGRAWDEHREYDDDPAFGYYLAGLIDGEGCFRVQRHERGTHNCTFTLKLRRDDRAILERAARWAKAGTIADVTGGASNPMARWAVQDQEGCQRLVDILDKYPLRAKKALDYASWREAVCEWTSRPRGNRWSGPANQQKAAALKARIKMDRGYTEPPWSGNGYQDWCRLWARECLRVLKPGGWLVAFGGTRTWHRLVCAIEDAGFEIRDSISCSMGTLAWYYGSGFPKSLDVSRDASFCQCLPDVRGTLTEDAAESAAQVLLSDLRRAGQADLADIADLHGLSVSVHPDFAIPGRPEQDVLSGLREPGGECHEGCESSEGSGAAEAARQAPASRLPRVQQGVPAAGRLGQAGEVADVLTAVQREGARPGVRNARAQGVGGQNPGERRANADAHGGLIESGLERRRDLQAGQGQLRGAEVCSLPAGANDDGQDGRLHHGTPACDGPVDRQAAAEIRSGQSQGPRPAQQRQDEPGVVSVECGSQARRGWPICGRCGKPALPSGLGTALKPAWEPITLARKPLAGTVAQNVLAYGTGALNIDACRVKTADDLSGGAATKGSASHEAGWDRPWKNDSAAVAAHAARVAANVEHAEALGRWPSNVLFSHSAGCEQAGTTVIPGNIRLNPTVVAARANIAKGAEAERRRGARGHGNADGTETVPVWICQPGCPVAELDRQSGVLTSGANPVRRNGDKFRDAYGEFPGQPDCVPHRGADSGGASRFFPVFKYEAKAPASERPRLPDGTAWPTVKPLDLMRFLCRLVTRPGGLILDPFCGTGTTASAALIEGFRCVLIERDPVAAELAKVRLAKPVQPVIFGGDL